MKATIEIDGLRVWARHGVLPQERVVGNEFEISVALDYPPALKAVETDAVEDTLNYATLIELILNVMTEPSALIEHVAGRIKDSVLKKFPDVTSGRITVSKIAPPVSAQISAARFTLSF